jgi:hypothetical protein
MVLLDDHKEPECLTACLALLNVDNAAYKHEG